jgi:hypothetical protein
MALCVQLAPHASPHCSSVVARLSQTTLPEFGGSSFAVTRRFSDFDWFHDQLVRLCPGSVVPPAPEKAVVGALLHDCPVPWSTVVTPRACLLAVGREV